MSIVFLNRQSATDTTDIAGNEITAGNPWIMRLSDPSSTVTAYNSIESGGAGFGFPLRGDPHADLESLKMIDYSVSHLDTEQELFLVTANYSNVREVIDTNAATNPLDLPISYSYDQVDLIEVILEDQETGDLILNYLGKPPSTPFTENLPLTRITVIKNERRYNNETAESIRNTVNATTQRINGKSYTAGTVKLERFTGNNQFDQNGREYYVVTYSLLVNKKGFKRKFMQVSDKNKFGNPPSDKVEFNGIAYIDEDGTFRDPLAEPKGLFKLVSTLEEKSWSIRI